MKMEEENYDIYGDLENFEFGEKLKEKNDEIESLTERLNQSVVVITELEQENKKLKKDNRVLHKNTSSLLLTSKLEINRKKREINLLQQKLDNKIFRRPNNLSIAIQTDVTIHPSFKSHMQSQSEKKVEDSTVDKQTTNSFDENIVPADVLIVADNVRASVNNSRIPKKNPNARLAITNERTKVSSVACVDEKSKDIQCDIEEQQKNGIKKYHIPKKNPSARRLDVVEVVSSNATHYDHTRDRNNIIESRDKVHTELRKNVISSNRRIEGDKPSNEYAGRKNNRRNQRNQRNQRTSAPYRLDKGRDKDGYAYSDERRCNVRNINSQKRARSRDESDVRERHSKLSRYPSKSNNYQQSPSRLKSVRSRSKSAQSRSKSARSRSKSARSRSKSPRSRSKSARSRSKSARSRSKSARSRSKSARSRSKSARSRSKSARSTSKSARPRSKSARREEETRGEKLTKETNLKANDLKSQNQEKSQNMEPNGDASLSEIADQELEAILLAKTRILQDIDNEKNTVKIHEQIHKEIAQEEPRKKICLRAYQQRKAATVNNCSNTTDEQCSEDRINSTKEVTSNSINRTEDNFVVETLAALAETTGVSDGDQMKIIEKDIVYEDFESNVHPSTTGNNQRNSTVVISPDGIVPPLDPASLPSQTLDDKVATPVNETPNEATLVENNEQISKSTDNRLENNEDSNSAMDIDYELTVLPTFGGKINVTNEENSKMPLLPVDQHDTSAESRQSSGALSNKSPQKMSTFTVQNIVEKHVPEIIGIDESKQEDSSAKKSQPSVALCNKSPQKMPTVRVQKMVEKHVPEIHGIEESKQSANSQNSVALSNKSPQKMPTVIVEKMMENGVRETHGIDENKDISNVNDSLNNSFERHVLSKTMEYTVQDVGHEVHIYLTKKRKKSRKVRIVVEV